MYQEQRICQLLSNKVYVNRCLKDNIKFNRDLLSMLDVLLYLRLLFTETLFKKSAEK
jgi:hypothetical protein